MNLRSFKRAIYSLDIVFSIIGLLGSLVLILVSLFIDNPQYTAVGIILLLSCLAYLAIGRDTELTEISESKRTSSIYLLFNILFFAGLLFNILSLYLRPDPYIRPLSYFISIVFMVGILAAEILFLPRQKPYSYFVLTQIMIIPLSLIWSQLLIFPTLIGDDPWWHQWFAESIVDSGFIFGSSSYARLPVMHLVSGITIIITGLDYKMASLFSISSINAICLLLFIFLLGRLVINAKAGLLAALLLGVSVDFIGMSSLVMPNTFAVFMIPTIIYMLFKLRAHKPLAAISLSILLMATLILTHTIVSMCMAILLLALWAGFKIFNLIHNQQNTPVTFGIAMLFFVAMFGWWAHSSGHLVLLANLMQWGFSLDYWLPSVPAYQTMAGHTHLVPVSESLFNSIGRYLLIGISLPGCFYMLSKRSSHPHAFSLTVGAMAIAGMVFIASVANYEIQTGRWHYFVQVLVSVPIAVTLLLFAARIRSAVGKIALLIIVTAALAFLMILTPTANLDNPLFKNTVVRKVYAESELQATETILELTDRNVATDGGPVAHFAFLPQFPSNRITSMRESLQSQDFTNLSDSVIMIRRELNQSTMTIGLNTYTTLGYDPAQVLTDQGYSRIYECGTVSAFYWNSNHPPPQEEP